MPGHRANAKSFGGLHSCHREARRAAALGAEGDEAISIRGMGDCFASLAMTYGVASTSDFAFAVVWPPPTRSGGLVQKLAFQGNSGWGMDVASERGGLMGGTRRRTAGSVAPEACVAEPFQPVWVRLTGQEFGRTVAHALGPVATGESPVVQVEPQQIQIPMADLPSQEEVAA